jgi:hypothetical protein
MRTTFSLLALTLATSAAWADGNQSIAVADAAATIVPPIVLTKTQDLWFGQVVVDPGGFGRVITQTAGSGGGNRAADSRGVHTIGSGTHRWHNAEFEVTGQPDLTFSLDIQRNSLNIRCAAQGRTIPMVLNVPYLDAYRRNAIGPDGKTKVSIGGTLLLPSTPAPGTYQGQFQMTVAYN